MGDSLNAHSQYPGFQSSSESQLNHTLNNYDASAPTTANGGGDSSNYVPRPKRIACVVCRRRKLKCDGNKPSCGTCSRLGHSCAYDEVRKKSGPKRGYVKQLEARLAQVEMLLPNAAPMSQTQLQPQESNAFDAPMADDVPSAEIPDIPVLAYDMGPSSETTGKPQSDQHYMPETGYSAWDMLSLGLEEPLPAQSVINELTQIFFEKVHPSIPIIHRPRYMVALNLAPNLRPPVHLQYSMWCHAAALSDKYYYLHGHFYQRARKYAELEEMRELGEGILSLAYCQTWIFITTYESRMLYFPRAWLSTGKCGRLALMMGMNRLDRAGLNVKQSLPQPKDWTEREERRRTFWMVFCCDRYASIGTSWPMLIDERDIMTNLPASEEAFVKSKPEQTMHLADVLAGDGTSTLSPLGSVVLLASLFGRNLTHLHRPDPQDNDYDLNGEFWKRHRSYDNILLNIALQLPIHLRLPGGMDDPNVIFSNMCIHTSTICLHQAAIFKAERNKLPTQMVTESKRRCIVAADQISNIMKLISHTDLTVLNPFLSFCVYVAARVFVQYLKSRPDDTVVQSSFQFITSALNALKNKNPLTETFLVQLDVDTEGMSLDGSQGPVRRDSNLNTRVGPCQSTVSECPAFLGLPHSRPEDEDPLRDDKLASNTPYLERHQADLNMNKQKQTGIQRLNSNTIPTNKSIMQRFARPHATITPGVETAAPSVSDAEAISEHFSSDNNNNHKTTSDHPTPSTLDSSSSASYPRPDPPISQQPSSTIPTAAANTTTTTTTTQAQAPINPSGLGISSSATTTGSNSGPPSIAGQLYQNNLGTAPFYPGGGPEASFTMPSPPTWDFTSTQANMPSPGNITPGTTGPFNEAQLEQLLSGTNWDAWRD